ncbi:hypothetical protein ACHAWX_001648 [Stephanocyclus meneghinianus]
MSNIDLLVQRCEELENHNNVLRTKNNKLKNRLTKERRYFADMAYTLKYEMDALKNMIMELEGQVAWILRNQRVHTSHIGSNPEIDVHFADDIADISYDEAQCYQSDFELVGSLCDSYCELEGELHNEEDGFPKKMNQNTQKIPQQQRTSQTAPSPIKNMVGRILSLTNRVKKKSLHINEAVENGNNRSSLCRSSLCRDGTDTTQTTAEASFSIFCNPPLETSNNHCLVLSMRWKPADFHSGGLYSGQIDVSSKLPDGFGVFYCSCNDDNCYLKGEWRFGELIQHLNYDSDIDDVCDEDKGKNAFFTDNLFTFVQDVQGNIII